MMAIHHHDHVLRFRFESTTRPEIAHVVDLGAFEGFGECSCEDFQYRLLPKLLRKECDGLVRCKHLLAARAHLADQVISRILESENL
jgi:hypothetical protein